MQKGLICKITGEAATFESSCENFSKDEYEIKLQKEAAERENAQEAHAPSVNDIKYKLNGDMIERLRQTQDLLFALVGGLAAALLSALLWAVISVSTNFQIGFMAIGVGLIVGFAVRYFGSGIDKEYGIIGAVFALLGCISGNFFAYLWFLAENEHMSLFTAIQYFNFELLVYFFEDTFNIIDLLFYGIAVTEGYKFAFRRISPHEITLMQKSPEYIPYPANQKLRLPLSVGVFAAISIIFFTLRSDNNLQHTLYHDNGEKLSEGQVKNDMVDGHWKYYDKYGQLTVEGSYNEGIEHGKWIWYDGGAVVKEVSYRGGMPHGSWTSYYINGQIADSGRMVNGRKTGLWHSYYENGQLSIATHYDRDKLSGQITSYYENGKLQSSSTYEEDEMVGTAKYYHDNGQLWYDMNIINSSQKILSCYSPTGEALVSNGNGTFKMFTNGKITQTGNVESGKKVGIWKFNYPNGKLQTEGYYDNKDIYVVNKYWNENGNLIFKDGNGMVSLIDGNGTSSGEISHGYRIGKWNLYSPQGILVAEKNFNLGQEDGSQKFYFPSGQLQVEGYYSQGAKSGIWYWYFENGEIECSINYENDKKEGLQTFYNELGLKVKEEIYSKGELNEENLIHS